MIDSTNETVRAIVDYASGSDGGRGKSFLGALSALARGEIQGELTLELIEAVMKFSRPRDFAEFFSPVLIQQFMSDLAEIRQPRSVLDPTCGGGVVLKAILGVCRPEVVDGIELNPEALEVSRVLLRDQASIMQGNALDQVTQLEQFYDLIVVDPPIGFRVVSESLPPKLRDFGFTDFARNIAVVSCGKLSSDGLLAVVVTRGALGDSRFKKAIHSEGCRIRGILHMPPGSMRTTMITSYVVVIERGPQEAVFVGQLSEEIEHRSQLLKNFKTNSVAGHPALGSLVALGKFIGFDALESEYLLKQRVQHSGLAPVHFLNLIAESRLISREALDLGAEVMKENSVLLTRSGLHFFIESLEGDSKDKTIKCFGLDSDKVRVDYLRRWFDTELGQLALRAAGVDGSQGRLRFGDMTLERLVCHLPAVEEQDSFLEAIRNLEKVRNEANEIEEMIWAGRHPAKDVLVRAKSLSEQDRYEDWLATLPYPLASILWRHQICGDDSRIRFGVLLHFFEALAAFLATIHLSAFRNNSTLWSENHEAVSRILSRQNLSLKRATFGTWKVVVEKLSASTRKMLEDSEKGSLAESLYSVTGTSWLQRLCDAEISNVLAQANKLRNAHSGHGGALGIAKAKELDGTLLELVEKLRSIWGSGWSQYELVLPNKMMLSDGEFRTEASRVMGANSQFERVTRATTSPLESGKLHFLSQGHPKALKLLPLVRVMSSPRNEANACYFYNSSDEGGQRFVSYHFESEAEVCEHFEDTAAVLEQLSAPPQDFLFNS